MPRIKRRQSDTSPKNRRKKAHGKYIGYILLGFFHNRQHEIHLPLDKQH